MKSIAGKFRDDAGQAIIELVILLPMLAIILVGVAEFGRFAYAAIEVSNAAHAGAQYAAQNRIAAATTNSTNIKLAATQDATDINGISATTTTFCACSDGSASTCAATDCSASRIIEFVKVNTTATISPIFSYPGVSKTLTLTGQATMRVEQ